MSNPLAEYLAAIEARDVREKAHEEYINACTSQLWMTWSQEYRTAFADNMLTICRH
jgi:sulfur transfer protein SufE